MVEVLEIRNLESLWNAVVRNAAAAEMGTGIGAPPPPQKEESYPSINQILP